MIARPVDFLLSILVPVFNEEDNIRTLYRELTHHIEGLCRTEIIFINDGSSDRTLEEIQEMHNEYPEIHYLSLSRNFGHQSALKAGLDFCSGDVVISMDGDLQHPPHLIVKMLEQWKNGYDVVITTRQDKEESRLFKKCTSQNFYRLLSRISSLDLKPGTADFRLLDRKVVEVLKKFEESDIFFRGMVAWSGFKQFELPYIPEKRSSGETKYTLAKMLRLALNGLLGFSTFPLRMVTLIGMLISVASFLYGFYAIFIRIFSDEAVSGWASVMTGIYFLGGIQLISIGICGEYIGRIFMQTKKRPHYIIADTSLNDQT